MKESPDLISEGRENSKSGTSLLGVLRVLAEITFSSGMTPQITLAFSFRFTEGICQSIALPFDWRSNLTLVPLGSVEEVV